MPSASAAGPAGSGPAGLEQVRRLLLEGLVIPAHPLALDADRRLDERRQRALSRYYLEAGAGGLAVGVHTTQFGIHQNGMLRPVLTLAAEEVNRFEACTGKAIVKVAGVIGRTPQAVAEAQLARELGYDAALLSLAALREASDDQLLAHCRQVAEVIPLFGFYLQPAVGGRLLGYGFWRRFFEIENVVAVKVAPFNRYQTLDVVRALAASGRAGEVALYTGNDDHIVLDLVTRYRFPVEAAGGGAEPGAQVDLGFVGGLLGQWAVWTRQAVAMLERIKALLAAGQPVPQELIIEGHQLTDANAALFDVANHFHGCIAGIHEALRRQGLLAGTWCLDPAEGLSPGQAEEIDRIWAAYPHLRDDEFVQANLDRWLAD